MDESVVDLETAAAAASDTDGGGIVPKATTPDANPLDTTMLQL